MRIDHDSLGIDQPDRRDFMDAIGLERADAPMSLGRVGVENLGPRQAVFLDELVHRFVVLVQANADDAQCRFSIGPQDPLSCGSMAWKRSESLAQKTISTGLPRNSSIFDETAVASFTPQ